MFEAVIFGLDGVLVATKECHARAWRQMADEQGFLYNDQIARKMQGRKRMDCLRILLQKADRAYSAGEMLALAARKNDLFNDLIAEMGENNILPGAMETLEALKSEGVRMAVASSSENVEGVLRHLQMKHYFEVMIDGDQMARGKPDPDAFLQAARQLQLPPEKCLAVEDDEVGREAALRSGMKLLALGGSGPSDEVWRWAPSLKDAHLAEIMLRR